MNQLFVNLLSFRCPLLLETLETCSALGIRVMAYSQMGQGLLTEGLTKEEMKKKRIARITGVTWEELRGLRNTIQEIAQNRGKTMGQVCTNWALCHSFIPLVGVRKPNHVTDALEALTWKLNNEEITRLDAAALSYSTLQKSKLRRAMFIFLISLLMIMYKISHLFDSVWRWFFRK